jgi:phosphoribosylaminoimidazolecarboxamide formyltransferase/IMP cyclohydrolase
MNVIQATIANPDCTLEDATENIDIGGPAMLRSSAKNHVSGTVEDKTSDYQNVIDKQAR